MLPAHKFVRNILRHSSRTVYDNILRESKLLPIEAQCLDLFILDNKTQLEIAAQINLSERSVRLYLSHAYKKIFDCRLFANALTDTNDTACYAMSIGGDNNVWYDQSADADSTTDGANPSAAVHGTVAFGRKLPRNACLAGTA